MSCYVEMFGKHMIETSCARQSTVALSSGEAEYYALTRGVSGPDHVPTSLGSDWVQAANHGKDRFHGRSWNSAPQRLW